jgi:ABC-type oligopeptide transport system substrate-binding subunit
MTWIAQLRQRSVWLLLFIAFVLSLSLAACGQQVNASDTNALNNNTISHQQQYQPNQPAHSSNTNANTNTNLQSTDQQVQSILSQLEGAHNDVNSSNAASSQDNGQQP